MTIRAAVLASVLLRLMTTFAVAEVPLTDVAPELSVAGSLRLRSEAWNFFDPGDATNDDHVFGGSVARFMVAWRDSAFDIVAEGQTSALVGLPDDAAGQAPIGPLGLGAVYFLSSVVDKALQIHGAAGATEDLPLSYFYRQARLARIYDGANEVHKMVVARRILGRFESR